MKKTALLFAATIIAGFSLKAQAPQGLQRPPQMQVEDIKAIDSINVMGLPINIIVFQSIAINGSVASVSAFLGYSKNINQGVAMVLRFGTDNVALPDTLQVVNIKRYAEMQVTIKHGVNLK